MCSEVDPDRVASHVPGQRWPLGGTRASLSLRARSSSRYLCTIGTLIEPSPTAAATRLTLPARTSPAANTPGTLVSKGWGGRASGHVLVDGVAGEDEAVASRWI